MEEGIAVMVDFIRCIESIDTTEPQQLVAATDGKTVGQLVFGTEKDIA